MIDFQKTKEYSVWIKLHCLAVFAFVAYYILRYISVDYYGVFYNYYLYSVPVLFAFYLFFRRTRDGKELQLMLAFMIWLTISRFLNGDFSLSQESDKIRNMAVMILCMSVGLILPAKKRLVFMDCISIVICLYFTALAILGVYGTLYQRVLYHPFTGDVLVSFYGAHRLCYYGLNPNAGAYWFLVSFFLLFYLFFRTKKIVVRVFVIVFALINYLAVAFTFCRNVMLGISVGMAMLVILMVFKHISPDKKKAKALVVVLIMCTVLPMMYSSFSLTTKVFGEISYSISGKEAITEPDDSAPDAEEELTIEFSDSRGFSANGRIPLYLSFIDTIKTRPERLLKGCMSLDVMSVSNAVLPKPHGHFHNVFLQTTVLTGIPGLTIVAAFLFLLVKRMVRLYFSTDDNIGMPVKVLIIILTGAIIYNMLDCFLFFDYGISSISFFIIAGMVIAFSKESEAV